MTTLSLDLGTRLGWALRWPSGKIEHGRQDFSPLSGCGEGTRFLRFRGWLHTIKHRCEFFAAPIDSVVFEKVDFVREGQAYNAHVCGGMWGVLTGWAEHHGIPYEGIANNTVKKAVAGHGRADKQAVLKALRARGFTVTDENEGDAIAILLAFSAMEAAA